ncbi:MAG: hypothetical protein ABH879_04620 [archaeon]
MRRSQVQQVFIYILGMIIVSFILLYGYKSVKVFKERSDTTMLIKFRSGTVSMIKQISSDHGTVRQKILDIPPGFKEICFVDSGFDPGLPPDGFGRDHPIILNLLNDGVKANIFLVDEVAKEYIYAGDDDKSYVKTDPSPFLCLSGEKVRLRIEGKGDHAVISQWT